MFATVARSGSASAVARSSGERKTLRELIASLTYLETCQSACETAVSVDSCPQCERHPDQPTPPELVIGMHAQ